MASPADKELLIRVRADIQTALKQLDALTKEVQGTGKAGDQAAGGISGAARATNALVAAGRALISLETARRVIMMADAYAGLQTRIRTATKATGDYVEVSSELNRISAQNGTALDTTVALFQNLARTAPQLQATNAQILELTEAVQQLGVIGGSNPVQMQMGLMQFSQMMAGGVARAEELNSLLENMPELAARIAEGMGRNVGELQIAVREGRVLSKEVFDSLIKQAPQIAREFENIPPTIGRTMGSLGTAIMSRFGQINEQLQLTRGIAMEIAFFADLIAPDSTGEKIAQQKAKLAGLQAGLARLQADRAKYGANAADQTEARLVNIQAQIELTEKELASLERKAKSTGGAPGGKTPIDPKAAALSEDIAAATAKLREQLATIDGTSESTARYLTTVGKLKDATDAEKQAFVDAAIALDAKAEATKRADEAARNATADAKLIEDLQQQVERVTVAQEEREQIENRLQFTSKLSADATDEHRQKVEELADALLSLRRAAEYAQKVQDLELEILRRTDPAQADDLDLTRKYQPLIKGAAETGDPQEMARVVNLASIEAQQREFERIAQERARIMEQLSVQEQRINTDREAGLIGEAEAQRRIVALHQDTARQLDEHLPKMRALAAALGPDAVAAVERYAEENRKLGLVIDRNAQLVKDSVESGLTTALEDVILQTKSAGEAFEAFGQTVLRTLVRIAAERATLELLSFFGFGTTSAKPASSGGGVNTSIGPRFASGGLLRGPGSGTSDSMLIRGSNGEFVMRAAAVRKFGVPFMEAINAGRMLIPDFSGLMPRFAGGGLVGTASGGAVGVGGTVVQIVNNSNATVRDEGMVGRDPDGREIRRLVITAVTEDIDAGGSVAGALGRVFGLRRSGRGG